MRITAEKKAATRQRILDTAVELFRKKGYEATTTRDIATKASIATGTLFNYFPTKEAIVQTLAELAVARARDAQSEIGTDHLEEGLFACIALELRQLKPHRTYLSVLLESTLSPMVAVDAQDSAGRFRTEHLELLHDLVGRHGVNSLSPVALHLYWTLYTSVLAFWTTDPSPKQEDTLALLDQSIAMFTGWLTTQSD